MGQNSTYNILMYSHDTYGLGHIRRTMAIASHLAGPDVNVLILTGSPIAGRFSFPEQVDFVRIPGMIKKTNDEYLPMSIKINPQHAVDIRTNIITATAQTFQPHLFIVDKEPLGLKKEVLPTLQWLRRCLPNTRTILGLRDIMDEAEIVRNDWKKKGVYQILDELYSEIWIYGNQDLYDPISEYDMPGSVSCKMHFTGYIPRKIPGKDAVARIKKKYAIRADEKLVLVTTGGGGDGHSVMHHFLTMLEESPHHPPFKSILITGPFMPKHEREDIFSRAKRLGIRTWEFYQRMEEIMAAADLVVTMGGYNTICEILSQGTISLVIPRETPRKEQLIRAKALHGQNLLDFIPWNAMSAQTLRSSIMNLLDHPESYQEAINRFQLTGLKAMTERLDLFRASDD
ncbi:MAG: glycosyltransferase [Pseudomonadota bacterium]